MKPKTTILLLLLLVIAGGLLLLLPVGNPPTRSQDETKISPLFNEDQLGPSLAVIRLFVSTREQPDLVLVKKNGRWWISDPHLFPAHRSTVDDFLAMLAQIHAEPVQDDDPIDPIDPDSERHNQSLTLEYTDRPPIQVSLGERVGAGRARIKPGLELDFPDLIAETEVTLHDYFDTFNRADFYARKAYAPIMPEVDQIDFKTIEGESTLVQHDGEWLIGADENAERALAQDLPEVAGVQQIFKLLKLLDLSNPQPKGTPLSAYGLEQPLASITLGPLRNALVQTDKAMTISLGVPTNPDDTHRYIGVRYHRSTPPAVFTAPTQHAMLLAQEATNFRDPRIVEMPASLIASINLKFGEDTSEWIEFPLNKPPIFHRLNSEQVPIPSDRAADLLRALTQTQALAYLPLKPDEWDEWVSATITPRLGGKPEPITVYDDPASTQENPTMLVRRGTEPVALRVPRPSVEGLFNPSTLVTEEAD